jgi:hypothetical protein
LANEAHKLGGGGAGLSGLERVPGLILHYALNRVSEFSDLHSDPALALFQVAARRTVVHLKPTPRRLIDQLSHRMKVKSRHSTESKVVVSVSEATRQTQSSRRIAQLEKRIVEYQQDGWVDELYDRWEGYICGLIEGGMPLEQIFLQPLQRSMIGKVNWQPAMPQNKATKARALVTIG